MADSRAALHVVPISEVVESWCQGHTLVDFRVFVCPRKALVDYSFRGRFGRSSLPYPLFDSRTCAAVARWQVVFIWKSWKFDGSVKFHWYSTERYSRINSELIRFVYTPAYSMWSPPTPVCSASSMVRLQLPNSDRFPTSRSSTLRYSLASDYDYLQSYRALGEAIDLLKTC